MISVEEAQSIILNHVAVTAAEHIPLAQSVGCILREDIYADRPMPPFDRVTMDGIAIRYSSWTDGQRRYKIEDIQAAGMPQKALSDPGHCMEVMTGAIRPRGTDTVIPYEEIEIEDGMATIRTEIVKESQNIHVQGSDRRENEVLIPHGKMIGPAEINICATVGKTEILVSRFPCVLIISTGDELVPVEVRPLPHQIRRSNVFGLQASLRSIGVACDVAHLNDDKELITDSLSEYIQTYDAIVLSGGVSAGKYDFVPEALDGIGVHKLFHKVRQRPGKPFWFGQHPSGTTVFALPGNPVSSFLCTYRYFMPWLYRCVGSREPELNAVLTSDIHFPKDLTYFAQVSIHVSRDGIMMASPVEGNGSGDLANLSDADAFIELPRGKDYFAQGEAYRVFPYRSLNVN